jgi:hypothetical protein
MDDKILIDITSRLEKLEKIVFGDNSAKLTFSSKAKTLPEIIRRRKFNSGQEKIAVIVGYYETIMKKSPIKETELKAGWKTGKFDGKYNSALLLRAIKEGWVRKIDKNLDLSQSGENFFEGFIKNEQAKAVS